MDAPATLKLTRLNQETKVNQETKRNEASQVEYVGKMQDQWNLKHRICQVNYKTGLIVKSCQDGNTSGFEEETSTS